MLGTLWHTHFISFHNSVHFSPPFQILLAFVGVPWSPQSSSEAQWPNAGCQCLQCMRSWHLSVLLGKVALMMVNSEHFAAFRKSHWFSLIFFMNSVKGSPGAEADGFHATLLQKNAKDIKLIPIAISFLDNLEMTKSIWVYSNVFETCWDILRHSCKSASQAPGFPDGSSTMTSKRCSSGTGFYLSSA